MDIRLLNEDDLNNGLLEVYGEVWGVNSVNDVSSKILNRYKNNDNHMLVVEKDNNIIGTLTLHLQHKIIRNGGISGLIEDVAIKKEFRGMGIGEKLVNEAIKMAKDFGCYKVILSCFPERTNFYNKCGFEKESITMRYNFK